MVVAYPAIFTPEENGGYLIEFPDIQGAFTGINNDDLGYGMEMASEVLGLTVADYLESGDDLIKPTAVNKVKHKEGSFVTLVSTDVSKYLDNQKLVKKTLTIPKWANQKAIKENINFSALLTKAILDYN
ncbi:antitoxin HicB [Ligilactobacillus salivarius]|uniref:Antitoxin HicB n=2 Tax=Ligilactobacillus salivarius TaxID=1624 RepID=A0A9X6S634_9LACO|nr:antitoxin HicB [Ligilactobacillus salivarius]PAY25889.1 antitoxin HicB [Ligilactobacillus salivarius]PAY28301.1 antitoxin HicB [Ligilactobacillus salivarius]PAY31402.1 antitoxin HicB [Ligilactobacillus salivarius]PAY36769.1 antitoxin HicB [Ligilactobacillus salivarius]